MIPRYETCTIFKFSKDMISGLKTLTGVRVYQCETRQGGNTKFADSSGVEYYPLSTFWVRSNDALKGNHTEPVQNEYIVLGDYYDSTELPEGARKIRSVTIHSNAKFGQPDSYTIGVSS